MSSEQRPDRRLLSLVPYLIVGVVFGITAIKSQIVSWYRLQEMFRFQSFHMHGVILSALAVAALSVTVIKASRLRNRRGETIVIPPKTLGGGYRYWIGGTIFGLGWGLAGACPGPIFALLGSGAAGALVLLASTLVGTWAYAALRPRLPH